MVCYVKSKKAILKPTPTIMMQYLSDHFNGSVSRITLNVDSKFQVVICGSRLQNSHGVENGWKRFSHLNSGNLLWLELAGNV